MTTFYVATLAQYVLVEAEDETQARQLGTEGIAKLGRNLPIIIRTIRPATSDEIEFDRWHQEALACERG